MSRQATRWRSPVYTSTISLLKIYTPLLARVHVHLADSKPLNGIAWHVLHDAIHPDYLLVMTHLKRIARHQDREKETQWAERVARKIEELRESMGVVA